MLFVTGSQMHVDRVKSFLSSLQVTETPDLIFKSYKRPASRMARRSRP